MFRNTAKNEPLTRMTSSLSVMLLKMGESVWKNKSEEFKIQALDGAVNIT